MSAQISFSYVQENVACNNSMPGKIEVNVVSIDPPYQYLWNNGDTTSLSTDLNGGNYTLTITDSSCEDTTLYFTVIITPCGLGPALAFTPNDDVINDTWSITNSQFFPEAYIIIFNRLGQKVHEQSGLYIPWDGRDLFGVALPDASYFYLLYEKRSDEETILKGCVSIIK